MQTEGTSAVDALVASMAAAGRVPVASEAVALAPRAHYQITKVRYTHEDCIDCIIAHPGVSQNELAARYGYSPAWISVVMNTELFKAKLAERRTELIDPVLKATIEERFRALAVRSLEVLQEKLSLPSHQVPDGLALKAAELSSKSLGLGGNAPPPPPPNPADYLPALAERIIRLQGNGRPQPIADANIIEAN